MIILGIESTCDETAASLVEDGRHLLSNVISTSVKEQALRSEEHTAELQSH